MYTERHAKVSKYQNCHANYERDGSKKIRKLGLLAQSSLALNLPLWKYD